MHLDRMYLLLQRLRRNKNFSRPAFAGLKASSRGFIEVLGHSPTILLEPQHAFHANTTLPCGRPNIFDQKYPVELHGNALMEQCRLFGS